MGQTICRCGVRVSWDAFRTADIDVTDFYALLNISRLSVLLMAAWYNAFDVGWWVVQGDPSDQ